MLTQCPGCQTVFRITGAILRAAHGQVRCGRCNTQFDAIEYLQEEEAAAVATAPESAPAEFISTEFDQSAVQHEEITLEGNRIEISGMYRSHESTREDPIAEHTRTVIEEFNIDSEEWQNAFAEPAEEPSTEEVASAAALSRALASLDSEETEPPAQAEIVPFTTVSAPRPAAEIDVEDDETSNEVDEDHDPQLDPEVDALVQTGTVTAQAPPSPSLRATNDGFDSSAETTAEYRVASQPMAPPRRARESIASAPESFTAVVEPAPAAPRWPWVIASCVLLLLLTGQLLHHYRQVLVRHPTFGPPLARGYALLGQTLEPQWELSAYSIKQWGIVSDPQAPGTLRVRASITNNAAFAQPYPLLKLTLEDRFGASLGTREFKPDEYLPSASTTRRLAAAAAANVDLAIVDPGAEAVGFQFNVCIQRRDGVECTG